MTISDEGYSRNASCTRWLIGFMVFNATFNNISVQSVPLTTDVVNSTPTQGEVHNIM
jgi:hypothetical protein